MVDVNEENTHRLKYLLQELTKNTSKLALCRDILKDVLERGLIPNALPESQDAATVMALMVPLTTGMRRLAKHVKRTLDEQSGEGRRLRR